MVGIYTDRILGAEGNKCASRLSYPSTLLMSTLQKILLASTHVAVVTGLSKRMQLRIVLAKTKEVLGKGSKAEALEGVGAWRVRRPHYHQR
eukprot:6173228-Pleurochrysis_carterae.AAC.2